MVEYSFIKPKKTQILHLFPATISLAFRQLQSVGSLQMCMRTDKNTVKCDTSGSYCKQLPSYKQHSQFISVSQAPPNTHTHTSPQMTYPRATHYRSSAAVLKTFKALRKKPLRCTILIEVSDRPKTFKLLKIVVYRKCLP